MGTISHTLKCDFTSKPVKSNDSNDENQTNKMSTYKQPGRVTDSVYSAGCPIPGSSS